MNRAVARYLRQYAYADADNAAKQGRVRRALRSGALPNLVPQPKLALQDRAAPLSEGLPGCYQATLTPTAREAVISYRPRGAGSPFKYAYDPATGERVRRWEIAASKERSWRSDTCQAESSERGPDWVAFGHNLALEREPELAEWRQKRADEEHARRAKGQVRRFARSNHLVYLWTLTYAKAEFDLARVAVDVQAFLRRVREHLGRVALVVVAEPHPEGHGWHVHYAAGQFLKVGVIRQCWARRSQSLGRVHVQAPRRGFGPRRISAYLSKYLSKGIASEHQGAFGCSYRPRGMHRYWVTQGFQPQRVRLQGWSIVRLRRWLDGRMGAPAYVYDSRTAPDASARTVIWLDYWRQGRQGLTRPRETGLNHSRRARSSCLGERNVEGAT